MERGEDIYFLGGGRQTRSYILAWGESPDIGTGIWYLCVHTNEPHVRIYACGRGGEAREKIYMYESQENNMVGDIWSRHENMYYGRGAGSPSQSTGETVERI